MLTKTIAFLGEYDQQLLPLLKGLASQNLHLLFVSHNSQGNVELTQQLDKFEAAAEFEFIGCEKNGCWEADVIIIYKPEEVLSKAIERIREVSTQKTVLVIQPSDKLNFKELLRHSRVIELGLNELRYKDIKDYLAIGDSKVLN